MLRKRGCQRATDRPIGEGGGEGEGEGEGACKGEGEGACEGEGEGGGEGGGEDEGEGASAHSKKLHISLMSSLGTFAKTWLQAKS